MHCEVCNVYCLVKFAVLKVVCSFNLSAVFNAACSVIATFAVYSVQNLMCSIQYYKCSMQYTMCSVHFSVQYAMCFS